MTQYLFFLNAPPYGTERSYNALRLSRGLTEPELIPDPDHGTLDEIAEWTLWTDKVLVF